MDSVGLPEITVGSYLSSRPILRLPASVHVIDSVQLSRQSGQSFVPVLNTIPGVRMEERSPGSYRLSIRGSLLRSPFGIRNIKIYLDEFPLTDAGGNSYLNLLDINCIHKIEVLKGPDGSLFGANSGGVVRVLSFGKSNDNFISGAMGSGSFGLFKEHLNIQQRAGRSVFSISQAYQRSDGCRRNSALDRKYFQLGNRWAYRPNAVLKVFAFYSDLNYKTPGGLTEEQWKTNPLAARPPTASLPGAEAQKAGVMNSTLFCGVANEFPINKWLRHSIAVSGSYTDFTNPFITNYEERNENTLSLRTFFETSNNKEGAVLLKFNLGGEAQKTNSRFRNYRNDGGEKDTITIADQVNARQGFVFGRVMIDVSNRFMLEAALSVNFNEYRFKGLFPGETQMSKRIFQPHLQPRLAFSHRIFTLIAWRVTIAKGYSTPTIGEIRSSDNVVNVSLDPEDGWNYETGFRIRSKNTRITWDASVFYYYLQHAIVRRVNENGEEFFINSGGTTQPGIESELRLKIIKDQTSGFFRGMEIMNSFTFSRFHFKNYLVEENNLSGNKLTGVPGQRIVTGLNIEFPFRISVYAQHTYTSSIPLNDANTDHTAGFHLFQLKGNWTILDTERVLLKLHAGADNLSDERYSLGNDLNASGGRYYNPAPGRNWFAGISWRF